MSVLEQEKKLEELVKKQADFLLEFKELCDLDEENCDVQEATAEGIIWGDIPLEWFEMRTFEYNNDMIDCQQMLLDTLKTNEIGDEKSLHIANKAFEELIHEARRIKKKRNEDIQKAQEVIAFMDDIVRVCNEHRKK